MIFGGVLFYNSLKFILNHNAHQHLKTIKVEVKKQHFEEIDYLQHSHEYR